MNPYFIQTWNIQIRLFLYKLQDTSNSYFQRVDLFQASIEDATYTSKCKDDENDNSESPLSGFMLNIPSTADNSFIRSIIEQDLNTSPTSIVPAYKRLEILN